MEVLKRAFELYLKSSIHVALAVVAFAAITNLHFELQPDTDLFLFIFFGTVTGYNFVKYAQIAKLHHLSLTYNLRAIQLFSLLCFFGLIYFGLKQPLLIIIASGILGIFTVFYTLPVLGNKKNLRSFSGIKIFVIALVWAGVTVILPVLETEIVISFELILEFVQRCLFVMVLTIPFDIRDLRVDVAHLGTIPQQFGVQKTRAIGTFLLSAVVILEIFKPVIDLTEATAFLIIVIITYLLIRKSVKHQPQYYAAFWVEGIPILWWLLLMMFEKTFG